jgi:benzoyl-CoA reductase/2-hydroxyglutaryl-CoA dehydratase subunit BcrC/BadD/HgdB
LREVADDPEPFEPRFKIATVGGVSCEEDEELYTFLAEKGACAVPLNCTGLNALEGVQPIEDCPDESIVEVLAARSFNSPACIRQRPNNDVYERISRTAAEVGASGIILKTLPFCDLWFSEKERMKASFDLPVLVLDSDYGVGTRERVRARCEAFLETLL